MVKNKAEITDTVNSPEGSPSPPPTGAKKRWQREFNEQIGSAGPVYNRSGIDIKPIYDTHDWDESRYGAELGYPGQSPMTRGIYPTMHRGRTWSQRQLIGFGVPQDYNTRLRDLIKSGVSAVSLIPCNSVYRGFDADQVPPQLLGTCGVVLNTMDDMDTCFNQVDIAELSTAQNDPSPFTLLALLLAVAKRRGVPWTRITGTSNQSDYISHYVANHMFFRLALPGARRVLVDHIAFTLKHVPNWNPLSVVGQHMQQAGATPAEAMAFTLSTAIQYARDCIDRGLEAEQFFPRFTFFFDISISVFEEIAKFRAGRRIWESIVREQFKVKNPKAWRFKFHAQTSGVDLTRQLPLNNIARVTTQAIAGILGGLQSLHTDSYDEVLSVPSEEAARIAVNTQNILREEAHMTDVIDPLGGSYYVEALTNRMEDKIRSIMDQIEASGGMFNAVREGLVQAMIGRSAQAFQRRIDSGEQTLVGVNKYQESAQAPPGAGLERPDPNRISAHLKTLERFKENRDPCATQKAIDQLVNAANSDGENVYSHVVDAAQAGVTHGEIVACLRQEYGDGDPLILP